MKPDQRRLFTEAETSRALADIYALFLRKIGDTNVLPDRPEIRGMLARVPHLIEVTENSNGK